MNKTKLYAIISPNEMNQYLQTIVIAPMTSNSKNYPTRVPVNHNSQKSWVVLDQIRTINRISIVEIFANLTEKEIEHVKHFIYETYIA